MKTNLPYDSYLSFEQMTQNLRRLAEKYSGILQLCTLAKTPEGREIWCAKVTDPSTGDCESKTAYYVDGSHHAGEVTGSMAALYFLDYLTANAEDDPEVASLLKKYAFYIIPRVSPDGAECYLATPTRLRSVNRAYPHERTLPGLHLEDVDGNGTIRSMRVKTPYGVWKKSGRDPRLMIKRSPDETSGEFYDIYPEGIIEGYDGLGFNPAPELYGSDFNRNYPVAWAPESTQKGAGVYPLSNIETKAVADFIIAHKNIASVITFHTHGGMFLYPPGFVSSKDVFKEDMDRYKEIGKIAYQETGYPAVNLFDEFTPVGSSISSGAMDDWCHYDRGIPAYTIECWDVSVRAGIPHVWPRVKQKSAEQQLEETEKLLRWSDEHLEGKGFMEWTPFLHPQLGEVEIGGFDHKFMFQNCPPAYLLQECEKHTRFMLRHVKMMPQVKFDSIEVTKLSCGAYKIEAIVGNTGYLPTYLTREAVKLKTDSPISVLIKGDVELLEGDPFQDLGHLQGFSGVSSNFTFMGVRTDAHDPLRKKAKWIVCAKKGTTVTLTLESRTGGTCSASAELD